MHNIIDELKREEMLDKMEPGRVDRRNRRVEEQAKRKKLNATLKPCPFCGGSAKIVEKLESEGECSYNAIFVQCEKCYARTAVKASDGYYGEKYDVGGIAELWNRRVEEN